jgi:serine/threonine protein kinase
MIMNISSLLWTISLLEISRHMRGNSEEPLSEPKARHIVFQVLHGLAFMHGNRFAHRDLKPAVSSSRFYMKLRLASSIVDVHRLF